MPGTLIKQIREQKKITQEEVARHIGMSQNAYSKIENNVTQLTINHIKLISKALEVSPLELLRDDFEIHRPLSLHAQSITKDVLTMNMKALLEKLEQNPVERHELYPILMYELQAADNILSHVG
ncbi:MAG: helix-turn-helix domain-containing protein [Chitinophagaceae bacterium]|nr:helix-turn-helix domain-containing protein [Chitinophagaceae bacterium]